MDLLAVWQLVLPVSRAPNPAWADTVSGPFGRLRLNLLLMPQSVSVASSPIRSPRTERLWRKLALRQRYLRLGAVLAGELTSPSWATTRADRRLSSSGPNCSLGETIDKRWQDALRLSDNSATGSRPSFENKRISRRYSILGLEIKGCERWIRELPEGTAVLGLMFSSPMSVGWLLHLAYPQRTASRVLPWSPLWKFVGLLAALFHELSDAQHHRGVAGQRAELWARLANALALFLRQLMGPVLTTTEPLHCTCSRPAACGSCQSLDFGLATTHCDRIPLSDLPAGTEVCRPAPSGLTGQKTACLFAASAPDEGMLEFGRATIKTLRAAIPVHAIEPRGPDDLSRPDIVENDAIRAIASDLACLHLWSGKRDLWNCLRGTALIVVRASPDQPQHPWNPCPYARSSNSGLRLQGSRRTSMPPPIGKIACLGCAEFPPVWCKWGDRSRLACL